VNRLKAGRPVRVSISERKFTYAILSEKKMCSTQQLSIQCLIIYTPVQPFLYRFLLTGIRIEYVNMLFYCNKSTCKVKTLIKRQSITWQIHGMLGNNILQKWTWDEGIIAIQKYYVGLSYWTSFNQIIPNFRTYDSIISPYSGAQKLYNGGSSIVFLILHPLPQQMCLKPT
jgi:hypothetical protein